MKSLRWLYLWHEAQKKTQVAVWYKIKRGHTQYNKIKDDDNRFQSIAPIDYINKGHMKYKFYK
jgi:hypothetical protein